MVSKVETTAKKKRKRSVSASPPASPSSPKSESGYSGSSDDDEGKDEISNLKKRVLILERQVAELLKDKTEKKKRNLATLKNTISKRCDRIASKIDKNLSQEEYAEEFHRRYKQKKQQLGEVLDSRANRKIKRRNRSKKEQ